MRFYLTAAAFSLATCLLAGQASATPFQLDQGPNFTSFGLNGTITFTGTPPPGKTAPNNEGAFIGPLDMKVTDLGVGGGSPIDLFVYCTDIFDAFQAGHQYVLSTSDLTTRIGSVKVAQINALLAHATPTTQAADAAIQAAIWEIINEPGTSGYSITAGAFIASVSSNAAAFAVEIQADLNNVTGANPVWTADPNSIVMEYVPVGMPANQSFGFLTLRSSGNAPPIPEPAALSVLGLGALGLMMVRRRADIARRRLIALPGRWLVQRGAIASATHKRKR